MNKPSNYNSFHQFLIEIEDGLYDPKGYPRKKKMMEACNIIPSKAFKRLGYEEGDDIILPDNGIIKESDIILDMRPFSESDNIIAILDTLLERFLESEIPIYAGSLVSYIGWRDQPVENLQTTITNEKGVQQIVPTGSLLAWNDRRKTLMWVPSLILSHDPDKWTFPLRNEDMTVIDSPDQFFNQVAVTYTMNKVFPTR